MWQDMVSRRRTIRAFEGKGAQGSCHQNERIPARVRTNLQTDSQASATRPIYRTKTKPSPAFSSFDFLIYFLFNFISHVSRFTIGDCAGGHRADNRDKNRDVLCVPRKDDESCLFIQIIRPAKAESNRTL